MIEVTKELILSLKSERGGYTKASLKKIGVSWPLKSGWKQRAIGTLVPDFRANDKLAFVPAINASESGLTFRFEMTSFEIPKKPTAKSAKTAKSQKPDHFPAVRNKVEADLDHFVGVSNMVEDDPENPPWKTLQTETV
jgi:hypothetical protein